MTEWKSEERGQNLPQALATTARIVLGNAASESVLMPAACLEITQRPPAHGDGDAARQSWLALRM